MKTVADVRAFCIRRFSAKRDSWLYAPNEATWPLEIGLSPPMEKEAIADLARVKAWAGQWRQIGTEVRWGERQWRTIGAQTLPERVVLASPMEVAEWAGESVGWELACARFERIVHLWPKVARVVARNYDLLAYYARDDFDRVLALLVWLESNPESGLYHRQIPLPGMHSKWIEERRGLICELFAAIRGIVPVDFYVTCGLKPAPDQVRIRILDPVLRRQFFGMGDLTVPIEDLANAELIVKTVFVVENLITGLSFNDMDGTLVIMARGYGIDILSKFKWLRGLDVFYWGDIDTHGIAILSRARGHLPQIRSVLMDHEVLNHHLQLDLVGREERPSLDVVLANLTPAERGLYAQLRQSDGSALRLEQERISWDYANVRLRQIAAECRRVSE